MTPINTAKKDPCVIDPKGLGKLLANLAAAGYKLIAPTVRDAAIVYEHIHSLEDLPQGWMDEQGPGYYRIKKTGDSRYFNFTVGPHSWKQFLHPPSLRLWQAKRRSNGFRILPEKDANPPYAFIGVRPCELKAIHIQDRVFRGEHFTEPHYDALRKNSFIVSVNCGRANDTCFCTSLDTGPKALDGFDLALTEFFEDGSHYFLVEIGSERGGEMLKGLVVEEADVDKVALCQDLYEATAKQVTRRMETAGLHEALMGNLEHPHWEEIADRCLSCANCTMVCPTCFCTTVEDSTDLTGDHAERWRHWDSCFTMDFTYVAGGHIRSSTRSRYRQWLTHKLATWQDQFGAIGCVGCGRCIAWCPVGIDITEEAEAFQQADKS